MVTMDNFTDEDFDYWIMCGEIAQAAHAGVKRKFTDEDYIHHPSRVARYVRSAGGDADQVAAAVLHDVIEDTPHTRETLLSLHVRPDTIDLVEALSRRDGETYDEFTDRALSNPRALPIKQADVSDNLATLPPGHGLYKRYIKTLTKIHGAK
jgi:(p)ppGpp synthase/HD superfamily hydrolase